MKQDVLVPLDHVFGSHLQKDRVIVASVERQVASEPLLVPCFSTSWAFCL
jgi:hypothetical protein